MYARYKAKGCPTRKIGIPGSVPHKGNVSRVLSDPNSAAEFVKERLEGTELESLEIYRDDGSLAKKVI